MTTNRIPSHGHKEAGSSVRARYAERFHAPNRRARSISVLERYEGWVGNDHFLA